MAVAPETLNAILKKTPPHVRAILTKIRVEEDTHRAEADGRTDAKYALAKRRSELQAVVNHYQRDGMPEEDFEHVTFEIAEITKQIEAMRKQTFSAPAPDLEAVEAWLYARHRRGTKLEHFVPEVPKTPKGANILDALKEQRESIEALNEQMEAVEKAHLSLEEAEARVISDIDQLAAAGAPDFSPTLYLELNANNSISQGSTRWPQTVIGDKFALNGAAMVAWLHKDELIKRAKAQLRARIKPGALSLTERKTKRAEIKAKLLEAERVEEVLFQRALAAGHKLHRRPRVSIAAVLQIREVAK